MSDAFLANLARFAQTTGVSLSKDNARSLGMVPIPRYRTETEAQMPPMLQYDVVCELIKANQCASDVQYTDRLVKDRAEMAKKWEEA